MGNVPLNGRKQLHYGRHQSQKQHKNKAGKVSRNYLANECPGRRHIKLVLCVTKKLIKYEFKFAHQNSQISTNQHALDFQATLW